MALSHHVGLEIAEGEFRLAELRFTGGYPYVVRVDWCKTELNYGSHLLHEAPFDSNVAKSFIRDLTLLFRRMPVFSSSITISIPAHVPFLATIPLDARLSPEAQKEHLRWEASKLSAFGNGTHLRVLSQELFTTPQAQYHVVVGIPEKTIQFLITTCALLTLDVRVVDISHFTCEYAIQKMNVNTSHEVFAVLGMHQKYFTLGLYDHGNYRGFKTGAVTSRDQYLPQVLHAIHELMSPFKNIALQELFVYGPASTSSYIQTLQSLLNIDIIRPAPLEQLPLATNQAVPGTRNFSPDYFTSAIGAALRFDS